jgi:NADH dehydrogenase
MTAPLTDTLITVFGGSGFLGRHVVRALAKAGCRVRVAVRRPDLAGHLQPLGRVGQIHAVQANLRYPASVDAAARDADVVINLVGILFERGRQKFEAVQSFGAEAVALAAAAYGARPVHVSAIADEHAPAPMRAARRPASSRYGAAVLGRHPAAVGGVRAGGRLLQQVAAIARIAPALPLIGGGATLPAGVCGRCGGPCWPRSRPRRRRRIYELGGPDVRAS